MLFGSIDIQNCVQYGVSYGGLINDLERYVVGYKIPNFNAVR
jgi:hypothetical protein